MARKTDYSFGMWFPSGSSAVWLNKVDLAVPLRILEELDSFGSDDLQLLEVGVWRGAWVTGILMNRRGIEAVGIDPYPNLDPIRTEMWKRLKALRVDSRFLLVKDFSEVPKNRFFDLIHVDGEHSEGAALRDLEMADKLLKPRGVIVIDDLNNFWHPGVASALHMFMVSNDYRMFAITASKGYLARRDFATEIFGSLWRRKISGRLTFHEERALMPYGEATAVLGQPVLIATYKYSLVHLLKKSISKLWMMFRGK